MGSSGLVPFKGLGPGQFIPTTKSIRHLLQKGSAVVDFCAEFVYCGVTCIGSGCTAERSGLLCGHKRSPTY